jgi:ubiquinone/menaquinone biosynthesis C-methylase UbiE
MVDFKVVTEVAGTNVTYEQLKRMYTRYTFAADFSSGKTVLEVACGSGQGLGLLSRYASNVVGVDIDPELVTIAKKTYSGRDTIKIQEGNAEHLDFSSDSFDVVLLYEAIYYLHNPESFIQEAKRVLKKDGFLIVCTANKNVVGFNPSPFSQTYFSVRELCALFKKSGFLKVNVFGDCLISTSCRDSILQLIKTVAVKCNLMPKTMKGKEWLKRVFMGKLLPMPAELPLDFSVYEKPHEMSQDTNDTEHKVFFVVGTK